MQIAKIHQSGGADRVVETDPTTIIKGRELVFLPKWPNTEKCEYIPL
jgi:hypothetical protein